MMQNQQIMNSVVPRAGTWIETLRLSNPISDDECRSLQSVPRAGTWIETMPCHGKSRGKSVVPRAGTWIETIDPFVS